MTVPVVVVRRELGPDGVYAIQLRTPFGEALARGETYVANMVVKIEDADRFEIGSRHELELKEPTGGNA